MRVEQRRSVIQWALLLCLLIVGCSAAPLARSPQVGSGDPVIGRRLITDYGCVGCHVVPGVRAEPAFVGPPLIHWGQRSYIAGTLNNNSDNLVRWISNPQEVEPGTAMPNLNVDERDARNIAAYLLSLE